MIQFLMYLLVLLTQLEVGRKYQAHLLVLTLFILGLSVALLTSLKPHLCAIAIVLLLVYRRNCMLLWTLMSGLWKYGYINGQQYRLSNSPLAQHIEHHFRSLFDLRLEGFDTLPTAPTVFVANYVNDRFENLLCVLLPNTAIIMRDGFMFCFGPTVKHCIFKPKSGSYEDTKESVQTHAQQGRSVFAYVSAPSTSRMTTSVLQCRTGMFRIAQELGLTVTPIAIDWIHTLPGGIIPYQPFTMSIGETTQVEDVARCARQTRSFFVRELRRFGRAKFRIE
jgi:hypothetical protein